jgi:Lar family restriction alleviation protein
VSEQSLKPCPFCGGAAQFQSIPNEDGNPQAGGEYVECSQCQSCTNLVFPLMDDVKRELAGRWNRRAEQSELALAEARRKVLEEALKIAENYEDVEDRSDGTQQGNLAMTIASEIRALIEHRASKQEREG